MNFILLKLKAEEEIINLTMSTAHSWYSPDLPDIVEKRIKKD